MKVDDIVVGIIQQERGSLMEKFDVQNTYSIVPVHTKVRQLLRMKWHGAFYVDMVLPFGVRSTPYIFTCIADLVEWVAKRNNDVTFLMHYLDDFHTLGSPGSSVNTIWTGLLTVFLSLASPSIQTNKKGRRHA